jgi:uncharacterized protein (DUF305 family)
MKMTAVYVAGALALASIVAGCGGDDDDTTAQGNTADAAFVADMIEHHQGAIEMARIAQRRGERDEIRELADEIIRAQEAEISTMRAIADELPEAPEGDGDHPGMDPSEMGMDMDPATLEDADPFDRAFIDMMIPHHEGAVTMSRRLLAEGEHPRLRRMAEQIITDQNNEIEQMRQWREQWYAEQQPPAEDDDHGGSTEGTG